MRPLTIVLVCICVASTPSVGIETAEFRHNKCALFCLAFCMHLLAPGVDRSDILLKDITHPRGMTFGDMSVIVEQYGFESLAAYDTPSRLADYASPDLPVIFRAKKHDHYYVCTGRLNDGSINLIDVITFQQALISEENIETEIAKYGMFIGRKGEVSEMLNMDSDYLKVTAFFLVILGFICIAVSRVVNIRKANPV